VSTLAAARVAPNDAPAVSQPGVGPEVERLRLLIERQPNCLLRIGIDGLVLAANDAALGQLGARHLGEALGRRFTEWMPPDQWDRWRDFAGRVKASGAASLECGMRDLRGNQHAVQVQGVGQPAHPDGVDSMIVTIRDASGVARLEQALEEHEGTRKALAGTRARVEALMKESAAREAAVQQREARLARGSAQLDMLLAGAVRAASQARRLVQAAAGLGFGPDTSPAADAAASGPVAPTPERAGDGGRTQ
jgi:hypothetical protein